MVKKNILNPIALIAGTAMGAGFLGIPHMVAKSGFLIGTVYLILLALFVLYVQLCLGEIVLRTKGNHHLAGYADKYLGKKGKKLMFLTMIFSIFSALIAYLIGIGETLSFILFETSQHAFILTISFWILMLLLTHIGLKALKYFGKTGFFLVLAFVFLITIFYFPTINTANLTQINLNKIFLPFGIILFSLLSYTSIPAAERLLLGKEYLLKKAIYIGVFIPFIVYFLFTLVIVGNFGNSIPQVATLALGRFFALLGAIAILTSYLSVSIALRDMLRFDFKISRKKSWLICTIGPLLLYLLIYLFNLLSFVEILSIAGLVSGGLIGIMVLKINLKSKVKGKRNPEYFMPINNSIILFFGAIFAFGTLVQLRDYNITLPLKITGAAIKTTEIFSYLPLILIILFIPIALFTIRRKIKKIKK